MQYDAQSGIRPAPSTVVDESALSFIYERPGTGLLRSSAACGVFGLWKYFDFLFPIPVLVCVFVVKKWPWLHDAHVAVLAQSLQFDDACEIPRAEKIADPKK